MIAIGEWHQEAYRAWNKSFPELLTRDFFNSSRSSDNSDDVSKIKFNAWIWVKFSVKTQVYTQQIQVNHKLGCDSQNNLLVHKYIYNLHPSQLDSTICTKNSEFSH